SLRPATARARRVPVAGSARAAVQSAVSYSWRSGAAWLSVLVIGCGGGGNGAAPGDGPRADAARASDGPPASRDGTLDVALTFPTAPVYPPSDVLPADVRPASTPDAAADVPPPPDAAGSCAADPECGPGLLCMANRCIPEEDDDPPSPGVVAPVGVSPQAFNALGTVGRLRVQGAQLAA